MRLLWRRCRTCVTRITNTLVASGYNYEVMLRFPKLTALLLAIVIPAIPALSTAMGCAQSTGMSCPRMPMQAQHEQELEHKLSTHSSCCCDDGAANPAPAQSLQAPVSVTAVHAPAPAPITASLPVVTHERQELTPQQPDAGISPQAVLCTFLI